MSTAMPSNETVKSQGLLRDTQGRTVSYLRLSVTDRCNMRCRYCLPEHIEWEKEKDILSFEEIGRVVRVFARLGVQRVRLTGGEPLVRRELDRLVAMIAPIPGIDEVTLTTNGLLLAKQAAALKAAGLTRLNISLDSLDPVRFREVTRGASLDAVLEGIEAAVSAGFIRTKINAVLMRDFNLDEAGGLLRFAAQRGLIMRFIELMPMAEKAFALDQYVSTRELMDRLSSEFTLEPDEEVLGGGPARYWRIKELGIVAGFISPLSGNFCAACNRIRLSADGRVRNCLAYDKAGRIKEMVRDSGVTDTALEHYIATHLLGKGDNHADFTNTAEVGANVMMSVGG